MNQAAHQLDKRFQSLSVVTRGTRPPKGWIRAIRDALGLTTAQLAQRLGVSQPRVVALEKAETDRSITLKSLERAAEALGCRVHYVLVPDHPLEQTLSDRATVVAEKKLAAVNQTMRLEKQSVSNAEFQREMRNKIVHQLLKHPARLWDEV